MWKIKQKGNGSKMCLWLYVGYSSLLKKKKKKNQYQMLQEHFKIFHHTTDCAGKND